MSEHEISFTEQRAKYECRWQFKQTGSLENKYKPGTIEHKAWDAEARDIEWEQEQSA